MNQLFGPATGRGLLALGLPAVAAAQASVEYAAKSTLNAVSGAGSDITVGVCHVDGSLFRCVHDYYPLAFKVIIAALCVLVIVAIRTIRRTR